MLRMAYLFVLLCLLPVASGQAERLDLDNPEHAVQAAQKLHCNLEDGKPALFWWTGAAYSRVPGERDRRLFDFHGMNIRACKSFQDPDKGYGYRLVSREVLVYQDPKTGEILRTWTNPWTGEELEVVHIANDPVNSRAITYANGDRGPYRLGATIKDGRGWMRFEVPLFYTNPLGGDYQEYIGGTYQAIEMFMFFFDADRMLDSAVTGLENAHVGWARVAKWLPWMRMGDRAGQIMYSGSGKRLQGFEDLPDILKKEIRTSYPIYTAPPPLDDDRPNETSWTFFKKYFDAQREAESQ